MVLSKDGSIGVPVDIIPLNRIIFPSLKSLVVKRSWALKADSLPI